MLIRWLRWTVVTVLLATVASFTAALLVVPLATHSLPLTVLTGSMRPTYPPGTIVVVRPVRPDELHVGDTVTFMMRTDRPETITHRIVSVRFDQQGRREFVTRGDANGADDPQPVREGQVRGTVWYAVPLVGHAATALSPGQRTLALRVVGGLLLLRGAQVVLTEARARRRRPHAVG